MSEDRLSVPAGPLLTFGEMLGITAEAWAAREEPEQLTYTDPQFSREGAIGLTLERIAPLLNVYGDAFTCRFLLGDLVVLNIALGLDEQALATFREQTRHSPTVTLDLRLDKARLVLNLGGQVPDWCRLYLYLFPGALERLLTGGLGWLESRLWGSERARKVILLVPDREVWLDGPYLAVLGGERIGDWREAVPQGPPDAERPASMYRTCRDNLKWQESWLRHLTPLHLQVDGQALPDDPIANALRVHLANLIILYTADRTVTRGDGRWLATYTGDKQSVELTLGDPKDRLGEEAGAGVGALRQMLEWAYDPRWSADRLPLVQIGMAQALHAAEPPFRYRLLLYNAASIFDGLQWHWKAFIEGKVDAYLGQVRALEDCVASTVQAFADQVSAMIKSLSDTMLAAVGALLGSFVAALFKDKFNPTIFVIGMLVYAVYVLVFPLGYNMLNQWGRYRALVKDFAVRCQRFEERLYPQKVQEIVGTRVAESQERFQRWFAVTLLAYVVVIILAVVAAVLLPGVVAGAVPPATPTPGP
jgi:hypothetical protein